MNVINFNEKACEKIQRYFDSYLDNELMVETNHEVLRHIGTCEGCARLLETRSRLKQAVKRAVTQEEAPAVLADSIRSTIRRSGSRSFFAFDLGRAALAAAAGLILAVGGLIALRTVGPFASLATTGRDAFQVISAQAQEIMRVGLVDHVHCTIMAGRWKRRVSSEDMQQATGRSALGPEFIGLVPMVQQKLGSKFDLIQGHKCTANHRQYVHLILTGENGVLLSLVITEKKGEAFTRSDIAATVKASGVPLYSTAQGQLEIAGFETDKYLAYVVSNLGRDGNLQVASTLAPPVYEFLKQL